MIRCGEIRPATKTNDMICETRDFTVTPSMDLSNYLPLSCLPLPAQFSQTEQTTRQTHGIHTLSTNRKHAIGKKNVHYVLESEPHQHTNTLTHQHTNTPTHQHTHTLKISFCTSLPNSNTKPTTNMTPPATSLADNPGFTSVEFRRVSGRLTDHTQIICTRRDGRNK